MQLNPEHLNQISTYQARRVHKPQNRTAGVAMILRQVDDTFDMLFIKRATHPSDPWSGQIAFPGGRREPEDINLQTVIRRETMEETRIDLDTANLIGRLDDQEGRKNHGELAGITVSCLVYLDPDDGTCKPNYEVDKIFWVPMKTLMNRNQITTLSFPEHDHTYPAIKLPPHGNLWGLTHRFYQNFLSVTR